ncbi:transcription repressor OFP8-like [Miscanthus floridulus]|uniref:transcription repressor OFP8-like n=1 Tax=Miscanthus floridulus TaxID=154761 RepID=UPI003457B99F
MPAPKWFQKLRRRRSKGKQQSPCRSLAAAEADKDAPAPAQQGQQCPSLLPAPPCAVSPNRASYYFASADRARQDRDLPCAADAVAGLLDVRVDVVHRRAGDRRLGGLDAPPGTPELKLRRIVTRPVPVAVADASESGGGGVSSATTSAATTPSTRARGFHVKPPLAGGRRQQRRRRRRSESRDHYDSVAIKKGKAAAEEEEEVSPPTSLRVPTQQRLRRWLYESLVVVKTSSDPERELAESMSEMVVANGIRSSEDLEELLACYLALNAAEHHRAVVAAFRHVWLLLDKHRLLI